MKRLLFYVILICTVKSIQAQLLSSERLEKEWARLYYNASEFYDNKKYDEAENLLTYSIDLLKKNDAENSQGHIKSLVLLGKIHHGRGDKFAADKTDAELLAVKDFIRPGSARYVRYLYEVGAYYSEIGECSKSIKTLRDALTYNEAIRSIPGMQSKLLHQQAFAHYCLNNIHQAIELEKECLSYDMDAVSEYYVALAYYYYRDEDWQNLEKILPNCYENSREPVLKHFSMSKAVDRAVYWDKRGPFFYQFLSGFAYAHPSETVISFAYDAALFSKGVLLAAENKSTEITLNSGDKELVKLYERYKHLKAQKKRSYEENGEMEALSDVLLRYQREHKYDFRTDFRISWRDVQNQLGDKDVAIEFVTVPQDDGSVRYIALCIKKGYDSPHLTKLKDFTGVLTNKQVSIYESNELYDMVWGELETELEEVNNVYFSPIGVFYNTGIEYLPDEMGINFCHNYNTFRLSSTKELVLRKIRSSHNAALFGGVDYDLSPNNDTLNEKLGTEEKMRFVNFDSLQFSGLRDGTVSSGFSYLPGTRNEVDEISKILTNSNTIADVYMGGNAAESSFKNLSSSDVSTIHIATHGFYFTTKGSKQNTSIEQCFRNMKYGLEEERLYQYGEDKRLTRSGLIFAGANNTLRQKKGKNIGNDGILYAYEIAGLNLGNVDMLVLSACQSGLGDIDVSEGVFGLQRSFKLAGVNSIMMSLWKVDDNATRILMIELYKNLYAHQTKREALVNAQMALRMYENGKYDHPKYWAAFVLLDALD